jgi:penicillin-binding protein 1A
VLTPGLASTETQMLEGVIQRGTGKAADIGEFAAGKTGTTENYGDAWFVGWNSHYTVAVWVGYPNGLRPMKTEFNGGPVLGGTFPALIWHDFMTAAIQIDKNRAAARQVAKSSGGATGTGTATSAVPPPSTATTSTPSSTSGTSQHGSSGASTPTTPGAAPPSTGSAGGGSSGAPSNPGSTGSGSGSGSGSGPPPAGSGSGSSGSGSSGSSGGTAGPSGGTGAPSG